jgi:hypothetical protein
MQVVTTAGLGFDVVTHLSLIIRSQRGAELPLLESLRPVLTPMDYEDPRRRRLATARSRSYESSQQPTPDQGNRGKGYSVRHGMLRAKGARRLMCDADLSTPIDELDRLMAKMDEGYDVVSGWRQGRWDGQFLTRQLPSRTANRLISSVSGVKLNDYGCTLKAYRRSASPATLPCTGRHRFIPVRQWRRTDRRDPRQLPTSPVRQEQLWVV